MNGTVKKVLTAAVPVIALVANLAANYIGEKKQEELIDKKVTEILNKKESKQGSFSFATKIERRKTK